VRLRDVSIDINTGYEGNGMAVRNSLVDISHSEISARRGIVGDESGSEGVTLAHSLLRSQQAHLMTHGFSRLDGPAPSAGVVCRGVTDKLYNYHASTCQ
jgi:hypothetical protein